MRRASERAGREDRFGIEGRRERKVQVG